MMLNCVNMSVLAPNKHLKEPPNCSYNIIFTDTTMSQRKKSMHNLNGFLNTITLYIMQATGNNNTLVFPASYYP
jgi:hypothetical protein